MKPAFHARTWHRRTLGGRNPVQLVYYPRSESPPLYFWRSGQGECSPFAVGIRLAAVLHSGHR
ncbi:Uncharacterised protein [Vibrio cholerae]|nr:Uncharacterised protein [Vibrio cholerae]